MDVTGSRAPGNEGADEGDAMIRLTGVGKTYDDGTVAVQDLDLEIRGARWSCWSAHRGAASRRR